MAKTPSIWITGASSGIGRAASLAFVNEGKCVFTSARRAAELEKLKTETNYPHLINVLPCDISSSENIKHAVEKIQATSEVDCLINNAGITSFTSVEDDTLENIDAIIRTNLLGAIYAIKAVLPCMIKNKRGTIINVLSAVTQKTFTNSSTYSASKWGLLGYANVLREEVRAYNIRVINIIPGATETPMWSPDMRSQHSARMMSDHDIAKLLFWAYNHEENMVPEQVVVRPLQGDI